MSSRARARGAARSSRAQPAHASPSPPSPPRTRSSPARSPARARRIEPAPVTRSPARRSPATRSPARRSPPTRSPARRSPARRSPARAPASKFPARNSPSRVTRPEPTKEDAKKSPAHRPPIYTNVDAAPGPAGDASLPAPRSSRTRRSEYTIKDVSIGLTKVEMAIVEQINGVEATRERALRAHRAREEVTPRASSRLKEQIERTGRASVSVDKSSSKSVERSERLRTDEESSEEELPRAKSSSSTRKLATPLRGFSAGGAIPTLGRRWEFGGRIGSAALMLLLPLWVFVILVSCAQTCSFIQWIRLKPLIAKFDWKSVALFASQVGLQAVSCLPILGRKADRMDDSGKLHCFNALFASSLTLTAIFTLDCFKINNLQSILDQYLQLTVLFYMFSVLLAIILYVKSLKLNCDELNPYGNTGFTLYDFWMGKELFPKFSRLDVKVWLHRLCNINGLILTVLLFARGISLPELETVDIQNYRETLKHLNFTPTLLLFSFLQLVYFLNLIINEHKITSSFSWQSEGVGYLQCVSSALYPFYFVSISKFVLEHEVSLSTNTLVAASALYFLGFVIYQSSNNIKYEFRKNPLQHKLAKLDVMPTFHGKRLLVSGLWGTVRHPNYAGDILMHAALALPGALSGPAVAVLPALTAILVLVHRAARDDARCRRRYGAAWQRYCSRVPSVLIPKIY